jgi:hypothetical protein
MPLLWPPRVRLCLLFSDWKNTARLNRNESDWLRCDSTPVSAKCASFSRWACRKRRRKFAVHAGGSGNYGGETRNVLIVSVLLPIAIDLALRSNMQRRVDVLWMGQAPVLLRMANAPKAFMRDAEVEDQAASLVAEVILDLHVAAPFACAGCNAVCPAVRKRGQRADTIQSCSLVALAPEWPVHVTMWSP